MHDTQKFQVCLYEIPSSLTGLNCKSLAHFNKREKSKRVTFFPMLQTNLWWVIPNACQSSLKSANEYCVLRPWRVSSI